MRKYPNERREYRSTKRKKERYNRIISIIIATKIQNRDILSYILGNTIEDSPKSNNGGDVRR
jgi:hypothetical protein